MANYLNIEPEAFCIECDRALFVARGENWDWCADCGEAFCVDCMFSKNDDDSPLCNACST